MNAEQHRAEAERLLSAKPIYDHDMPCAIAHAILALVGLTSDLLGVISVRGKVEHERALLHDWQIRKAEAEARLASVRNVSGMRQLPGDPPDPPGYKDFLAREMTRLISEAEIADRAIVAAEASLHEARVAAGWEEAES